LALLEAISLTIKSVLPQHHNKLDARNEEESFCDGCKCGSTPTRDTQRRHCELRWCLS
jgi:hypothetical protein